VNEVQRVQSISEEQIEMVPTSSFLEQGEDPAGRFVNGIAKVDDDVVMLLDLENLIRLPEYSVQTEGQIRPAALATEPSFNPEATPEDKALFHARAQRLRQPLASEDFADSIPLAVIGLDGEYFGIDLQIIREFSALRVVTPVPCCPEYIVGQMNLRGDILTLVDIRAALNMPVAVARNEATTDATDKVVVVQTDALEVGVLVDEVFDVMNLQPSEVHEVPSAVQSLSEEYLKGTACYGARMMSILDLPKILTLGALTVSEEV
jgi:purine-binding chemotaxis protein CheW